MSAMKYSVKTERAELVVHLWQLKVNRLKVFVKLKLNSNSHLIVCSCYRPPNSNEAWLTEFNNFLADICNNYDNVILAGDFNFRNIVWQSDIDAPTKETCKL
jgi:exonuclease III